MNSEIEKDPTFIDISPVISPQIANWPGDVSFERKVSVEFDNGLNFELSQISASLHTGAHADARSHYVQGGKSIDLHSLLPYYGACQVIEVSLAPHQRITPADIQNIPIQAKRVLFKTGSYPNPHTFNKDFNSLSPELIEYLDDKNCLLVGIDTPSIDPFEDKELLSHQALSKSHLVNLETLDLSSVKPGLYQLIALPLRIEGADASPVRAVLIQA